MVTTRLDCRASMTATWRLLAPSSSVTVNVTTYRPAAAGVKANDGPVPPGRL